MEKYRIAEADRPHSNIRWHMFFSLCITKATNTLRICNTYCFSTAAMVTRTRLLRLYVQLPHLFSIRASVRALEVIRSNWCWEQESELWITCGLHMVLLWAFWR